MLPGQNQVLPPEPASQELRPMPTEAPQATGIDIGSPEDIAALLEVALDPEFLKRHPMGPQIQQLATSINMIMQSPKLPPQEKQRLLEELLPKLVEMMEADSQ